MVLDRQADLFQVVRTLYAAAGFPCGLHRGEQQGHLNADDGYNDEQLDEREGASPGSEKRFHKMPRWNDKFD
jgi:hypothetical protein